MLIRQELEELEEFKELQEFKDRSQNPGVRRIGAERLEGSRFSPFLKDYHFLSRAR